MDKWSRRGNQNVLLIEMLHCFLYQYPILRHRCIRTFKSCNEGKNAGRNDGKPDICTLHVFENITNAKEGTVYYYL